MRVSTIQHELTHVPIHITTRFEDAELGIGTAFFYSFDGKDYLITNWHIVTGRYPLDNSVISSTGGIPDNLVVRLPYQEELESGVNIRKWVPKILKLYKDADRQEPIWLEHPVHGCRVDAIAIEIEELSTTRAVQANAESLDLSNLRLFPGMDVFVLGYPRGISGGGRFPLWKRGSIASEPDIHIDDLPKMYIDTATREGMSGSPVFAQESGLWAPEGAKLPEGGVFGKANRFLGVYSGRVGDDPFLAQLGIVWKEEAVSDILESKHSGASSFAVK